LAVFFEFCAAVRLTFDADPLLNLDGFANSDPSFFP
jgi:hypothetical protein